MPLYDYACDDCGFAETIQLKTSDPHPDCSRCGSSNFIKQFVPFQTRRSVTPSSHSTESATTGAKHDHHHGSHSHHGHSCSGHNHDNHNHHGATCSGRNLDKMIERHEKRARPVTIRGS